MVYNQYRTFSSYHNYRDGEKFFFSRILSHGEFQLNEPWLAKVLDNVVEEFQTFSNWVT